MLFRPSSMLIYWEVTASFMGLTNLAHVQVWLLIYLLHSFILPHLSSPIGAYHIFNVVCYSQVSAHRFQAQLFCEASYPPSNFSLLGNLN